MRKYLIVAVLFLSSCQKENSVDIIPPPDIKGKFLYVSPIHDPVIYGYHAKMINSDGTGKKLLSDKIILYSGLVLSHNEKKFIFWVPNAGLADLYTMDTDGQNETLLVRNIDFSQPQWSPDDRTIIFVRPNISNPVYYDIYSINADGSNEKRLTDLHVNSSPTFLPDNSGIIFSTSTSAWGSHNSIFSLYKMNIDGSNKQLLLTSPNKSYTNPVISPDGKKIAALVSGSSCSCAEIAVMNIDGTDLKQITFGGGLCQRPGWSPDSRMLAYTTNSQVPGIHTYTINADGSGNKKLNTAALRDEFSMWSRDGKYIIHSGPKVTAQGSVNESYVWITRADGLSETSIKTGESFLIRPVFIEN